MIDGYYGEGANGGCFLEVADTFRDSVAYLKVGWSCVKVFEGPVHVTWLAELVAIATGHSGGLRGFLEEHGEGGPDGGSYALWCDPEGASDEADG